METNLPLCTPEADSLFPYVPESIKILHSLLMRYELMVRLLEGQGEGMVSPHILCDGIKQLIDVINPVRQSAGLHIAALGGGGGSKLQGPECIVCISSG